MSPARFPTVLIAGLAALATCSASALGDPNPPPLYLTYGANGTLTVSLGDGTTLGASSAIVPGPYWVTFTNNFPAERDGVHKWHIFGPGLDLWTDLNCSDSTIEQYIETLRASSTYTVQDDYHPALQIVFRTTATGSSLTGASAGPSASGSSSTLKNTDVVGSGLLPYRGTLAGGVSATGALSLSKSGKPVSSLAAGRYTIVVADRSAKAAFTLKKVTRAPIPLTSAGFVGRKTVRLALGTGAWIFYSQPAAPTRFVVTRK